MVPSGAKILVGLPMDVQASSELLSWTIGVAAQPNHTVIAVHILVGKEVKKNDSSTIDVTKLRRAKAFVISILGDYAKLCQSKKVNLEARVRRCSNIGKGLVEEAASLKAACLVIGGSKNRGQRTSFEVMMHCFAQAPDGCSVLAVGLSGLPKQDSNLKSMQHEGSNRYGRDPYSAQKLHKSKKGEKSLDKKSLQHSPTESISDKQSPKTVLDGPEGGEHDLEGCFSPGDFSTVESIRLASRSSKFRTGTHSNIWKHLSMSKVFLPFFRSAIIEAGNEEENKNTGNENRHPSLRCFSYAEISHATNNFHPEMEIAITRPIHSWTDEWMMSMQKVSPTFNFTRVISNTYVIVADNMVGKGGYAEVYKGNLCDGQTIAVKRLAKDNTDQQKEKEFLSELGIIRHICHPNTTYLIGCCIENGLHLVLNFSPNGTLASALHGEDSDPLEWPVRYKVVLSVARGLHYLHKCCKRRIIHRDIKASNVLLGPDFEAQISDFGLAKWLPTQWTHHSVVPIEGTFGYLAPEYFMHGIVDEKTDVFSFGVLLLEIITGRRPVDSSKQNLLSWAKPLIEAGKLADLADPKLEGKYNRDQMHRLAFTALYCVRYSSIWRPSMSEVLQLITDVNNSKITLSWRTSEYNADDLDSCSMDFDCQYPISYNFEDLL